MPPFGKHKLRLLYSYHNRPCPMFAQLSQRYSLNYKEGLRWRKFGSHILCFSHTSRTKGQVVPYRAFLTDYILNIFLPGHQNTISYAETFLYDYNIKKMKTIKQPEKFFASEFWIFAAPPI